MWRNITRGAVFAELAQPWPENDQNPQRKATGNGVDHPGRIGVVITQHFDHPAIPMPAPGRIDDPGERPDNHGQHPEGTGLNTFHHRAGYD